MSNRRRIPDSKKAGRSKIVPYRHGEDPSKRHARRKALNLREQGRLREWAKNSGYKIVIKNEGHHWILENASDKIEWWPSSAKLIFNQKWNEGIHCHDYEQVIRIIEARNRKVEQGAAPNVHPRHASCWLAALAGRNRATDSRG